MIKKTQSCTSFDMAFPGKYSFFQLVVPITEEIVRFSEAIYSLTTTKLLAQTTKTEQILVILKKISHYAQGLSRFSGQVLQNVTRIHYIV